MNINRRKFLHGMSTTAMSAATMGTLTTGLNAFTVNVQTASDYKALVCVFLLGGMDTHDLLIPYDNESYSQYRNIRSTMLEGYGTSREQAALLPLSPTNAADYGNRAFALPPEMSNLHQLFHQGDAAIIGNVGPLIQPTSKTELENKSVPLPPRLFSHNDQQATWQSGGPEGAQYGWGGLFADLVQQNNLNQEFTNITTQGNSLFLSGANTFPYQVSASGASNIRLLSPELFRDNPELQQMLSDHFASDDSDTANLLRQDVTMLNSAAFASNQKFEAAFQDDLTLNTTFPASRLGRQLETVAKTIANKEALGVGRQIFFVAIGGFDTHDNQAVTLPALQSQIDSSVVSFHQAMTEMGLNEQVTLFTASDFGRTLAVNGDGTDHGWGSHHLVVGGAVNGQQIYGQVPPASLGHDWDAGNGRLIPGVSIEQLAAPMGRWFGLSDAELAVALPNLANFSEQSLDFI